MRKEEEEGVLKGNERERERDVCSVWEREERERNDGEKTGFFFILFNM